MNRCFLFFFIILLLPNSYSQDKKKGKKELTKIHLHAVKIIPRDSFIESQITKTFIRDISRLVEREIIIGENINYRRYVVKTESLKAEIRNKSGFYDVVVSYRNESSGKLINQIRRKKIRKQAILGNIEDISSLIFTQAKREQDQIVYVGGRSKKGNVKVAETEESQDLKEGSDSETSTNVIVKDEVLIQDPATGKTLGNKIRLKTTKVKNWEDRLKKGRKITITIKDPPPEEPIPFIEEEPEPEPKPVPKITIAPPPIKPPRRKPKKKRKKWNLGFMMDVSTSYHLTESSDLLSGIDGGIPQIGLRIDFGIFKGNDWINDKVFMGIGYPLEKIEFQEQSQRLTMEYSAGLGVQIRPFRKYFNLELGGRAARTSFVSVKEPFEGLVKGNISTISGYLSTSVDFKIRKFWNEIGATTYIPFSKSLVYDSTREDFDFSEQEFFYKFSLQKEKNLGTWKIFYQTHKFEGERNPFTGNDFTYNSDRYGIAYRFYFKAL